MDRLLTRKGALWAGLFSVAGGLVLLFWTNPIVQLLSSWWPLVLMGIGVAFWYKVLVRKARPRYMFSGSLLFLSGVLLQLINLGLFQLNQVWPGFPAIIGLSFIPYSLRFRMRVRVTLLIPALTLLALSFIFFPFSLELVPEGYSFTSFATQWWPLVFIIFGISLLFSYYYRTPSKED